MASNLGGIIMAEIKTKQTLIPAYGDGIMGDALIDMSVQCLDCKHLNDNMTTCKAFEKGIPIEILIGNWDHTKPFKNDKENDNGISFERLEES